MRTLLIAGALGALIVSLSACGAGGTSVSDRLLLRKADQWEIQEIEKDFHESLSKKDIDMMMRVWAPNATLTAGVTAVGKKEIRQFWLKNTAFLPETRWVSDTPAYKIRMTVNGDKGTVSFECHFLDVNSENVVVTTAADMEVARINGRWLVTSLVGGSSTLRP
jgi:ketosteroid isomerase-like protein